MMMLKALTWQHFLVAVAVLGVIWYLGVWFFCFRKKKLPSSPPLAHRWADSVEELGDQNLIGKPAQPNGVSIVEAEDFSFAPSSATGISDESRVPEKTELLGVVSDVQQEIKSVCAVLEQHSGTKEDFFALFEVVRSKYPGMASSLSLPELNRFIRERVPFHLSDDELENLWS